MCAQGHCANYQGVCVNTPGAWLGEFSIKFMNPHVSEKAYVSVAVGSGRRVTLGGEAKDDRQWKIALTAAGYVRFESLRVTGHILTIYENRRRRTEDVDRRRFSSALLHEGRTTAGREAFADDVDLWPTLLPLGEAHPLDATFMVRHSGRGVDDLEIWDPQRGVSLASADPNAWFEDSAANQGVAECYPSGWLSSGCEGRELVAFDPPLPEKALTKTGQITLGEIGNLNWWQSLIVIFMVLLLGVCLCVCALHCSAASSNPTHLPSSLSTPSSNPTHLPSGA